MEKIMNLIKTQLCRIIYNYKVDNNIWIFSSTDNKKFNYNSKYIFEHVIKNEPNITPYYIINDDDDRHRLQKEYGYNYFIDSKSIKGIKLVLSAGVWFTSAGLPLYGFGIGKNRLIINLWHGVPLKSIALMENSYSLLKRIYFKKIFSENYSYILTTSKHLVPIMGESFNVTDEKIKVWGQPRNDILYKTKSNRDIEKLYDNMPDYKKLILYAPTYRDNEITKIFPFDDYNKEEIENFLEEHKIIILIRTHISEQANIDNYLGNRIKIIDESKIDDIMQVLNLFDILITDYSSIYIDYLLLDRPIIFLPYDKCEYLNKRGMNFNYDSVTPGYKPNNMKQFLKSISIILKGKDEFQEDRRIINDLFNEVKTPCSSNICLNVKEYINKK